MPAVFIYRVSQDTAEQKAARTRRRLTMGTGWAAMFIEADEGKGKGKAEAKAKTQTQAQAQREGKLAQRKGSLWAFMAEP